MSRSRRPLVTISIPTYNRAGYYLRSALESALHQTYEPLEVVIVDNCSTDDTPELVRKYEEAYPNLRYVRNSENIGPFRNFQKSLDAARGDYFLMLHDDDCVDDDFVAVCLDAADYETNPGYIRTGTRLINNQGDLISQHPNRSAGLQREAYVYTWLEGKVSWYFASTLFNTDLLRSVGGFPNELLVDVSNFVKTALDSEGVNIEAVKASCRQHQSRITTQLELEEWVDEYCRIRELILEKSASEWHFALRQRANVFFSGICYRYATEIPQIAKRYRAYARIYRTFESHRIPPEISDVVQDYLPAPVVRLLKRIRDSETGKSFGATRFK